MMQNDNQGGRHLGELTRCEGTAHQELNHDAWDRWSSTASRLAPQHSVLTMVFTAALVHRSISGGCVFGCQKAATAAVLYATSLHKQPHATTLAPCL